MDEEEDPKDWEIEDEKAPENLRRKWVERDYFGKKTVLCPSCRELVPAEGVTCMFCGSRIYHESGLLGRLRAWIQRLFR